MITCRELAELLFEMSNGELSEEYREKVERHLLFCPSCLAYQESYCLTIQFTRQLDRQPLPARLARHLQALLSGEPRRNDVKNPKE